MPDRSPGHDPIAVDAPALITVGLPIWALRPSLLGAPPAQNLESGTKNRQWPAWFSVLGSRFLSVRSAAREGSSAGEAAPALTIVGLAGRLAPAYSSPS